MILEVKDLSVAYRGRTGYVDALKRVSCGIKKGEILGIVGESGCGKSTFALSILNLLPSDAKSEGTILFKGKNILKAGQAEAENLRGSQIGLIFQEPASTFNPVLSINYQFQEILEHKAGIRKKARRKEIIFDSLKKVRVSEPQRILNSYPHQLSGGQLQRVAIALAIALNPVVLIADEPTSSLDVTIESQIIHLFQELKDKLKLTIIFITHNLALVKALSDRVVVLYRGEIREAKSRKEVFDNPEDSYTRALLASFRDLEG
jgi:microcin C transport system ATP-binding protein